MSQLTLVPAVYRCPDHDNHEALTERVRERVAWEVRCLGEQPSAAFHVAVTCPGRAAAPETEHRRVYAGTWELA